MSAEQDWFERFERETPEPKLELIGGRLVIGNSMAGSRYYLRDLLTGWRTEAALAFATPNQWRSALHQAFGPFSPPDAMAPLETWAAWAETVVYEHELAPAGPMATGPHYQARVRLRDATQHVCSVAHFGTTFGHDFVMQLGSDGYTPDGMLVGRQATERLFQRYLHGPADLVWEVLLPGHERQDREVKLHAYAAGGVPHYWVVDPEARTIDLFSLRYGTYQREKPDEQGRYRATGLRGLVFWPDRLWREPIVPDRIIEVEAVLPPGWSYQAQEGIGWDDVPFAPKPSFEPSPISFEEFAAWCPRAKFEGDGERTTVGGHLGTRNVLGMLIQTFGLTDTVAVLHPRAWVAGLVRVEQAHREDAERKAKWWELARQAASLLRARLGVRRVAVIGSLTRAEPLHFWSELSLVVWGLKGRRFESYNLLRDLDPEGVVDVMDPERATAAEKLLVAEGAIDIP